MDKGKKNESLGMLKRTNLSTAASEHKRDFSNCVRTYSYDTSLNSVPLIGLPKKYWAERRNTFCIWNRLSGEFEQSYSDFQETQAGIDMATVK